MKIRRLFLLSLTATIAACSGPNAPPASNTRITNYQAQGNLQSTHAIGCPASNQLKNTYTPADLYPAIAECVRAKDYGKAAFIFALAGVYTRFDEQRVADETSHDVMSVYMYRLGATFSDREKQALSKSVSALMDNPDELKTTCARIRAIGPPAYYPHYMVQHGMQAFGGNAPHRELVPNFNPDKAWERSLGSYLHCSGVQAGTPTNDQPIKDGRRAGPRELHA